MTASLFVYGSLQVDAVMETVIGRLPPREAAGLDDFVRRGLEDRSYPGLAPQRGERTEGVVFHDLSSRELDWLDLFEGDLYERTLAVVETAAGAVPAYVYVIVAPERSLLSDEPWDLEAFRSAALEPFLEMCRAFRSEMLAADSKD